MSKKLIFCLIAALSFTIATQAQVSKKTTTTTATPTGTVKKTTHVVDNKNKTMVQRKTQVKSTDANVNSQSKVVYKKDGTVDRRYKSSKTLKNDGTPDMRYKINQPNANASTTAKTKVKTKTTVKK